MASVSSDVARDAVPDSIDAQLMALRALCDLVATGGETIRNGSITVDLDPARGAGIALLRSAEGTARKFGVRHRLELEHGRGTIHVSR